MLEVFQSLLSPPNSRGLRALLLQYGHVSWRISPSGGANRARKGRFLLPSWPSRALDYWNPAAHTGCQSGAPSSKLLMGQPASAPCTRLPGTPALLGGHSGSALLPTGSQRSGPRWAFPDRQAASVDRSFSGSSWPRGLCSLETFSQTGLAAPGHGPQWVLWARGRGPGPTTHPGGLADAQ